MCFLLNESQENLNFNVSIITLLIEYKVEINEFKN